MPSPEQFRALEELVQRCLAKRPESLGPLCDEANPLGDSLLGDTESTAATVDFVKNTVWNCLATPSLVGLAFSELDLRESIRYLEDFRFQKSHRLAFSLGGLSLLSTIVNTIRHCRRRALATRVFGASTDVVAESDVLRRRPQNVTVPFVLIADAHAFVTELISLPLGSLDDLLGTVQASRAFLQIGTGSFHVGGVIPQHIVPPPDVSASESWLTIFVDMPSAVSDSMAFSDRSYELSLRLAMHCARRGLKWPIAWAAGGILGNDGAPDVVDVSCLRSKVQAAAREGLRLLYALPESQQAEIADLPGLATVSSWSEAVAWCEQQGASPPSIHLQPHGPSPWPGLLPYSSTDSDVYFGRDDDVDNIWKHLKSAGFCVVFGPSGVGKSSLLQAGMVRRIHDVTAELPSAFPLAVVAFRPLARPFDALRCALRTVPFSSVADRIAWSTAVDQLCPSSASSALSTLLDSLGSRPVLLLVDQLESIFDTGSVDESESFIDQLSTLATRLSSRNHITAPPCNIYFVAAVRGNQIDALLSCRRHRENFSVYLYRLCPPDTEQLRSMITEPARGRSVALDSALVDRILKDATGTAVGSVSLPFVSLIMSRLWESGALTHASYQALGELGGILARVGDEACSRLREEASKLGLREDTILGRIFSQLVVMYSSSSPGSDSLAINPEWGMYRCQRTIAEMSIRLKVTETALRSLVEPFLNCHILTLHDDKLEIAHEVILYRWQLLDKELRHRRETASIGQDIESGAAHWVRSGRGVIHLWPGSDYRLVTAVDAQSRSDLDLSPDADTFLDACREAADAERKWARRRNNTFIALALAAAGFAGYASYQQREAQSAADDNARLAALGQAREARAAWETPTRRFEAVSLALAAYGRPGMATSTDIRNIVAELAFRATFEPPHIQLVTNNSPLLGGLDFSPNGMFLLTTSSDVPPSTGGTNDIAQLWAWRSGKLVRTFGSMSDPESSVTSAAFSSDGRLVLTRTRVGNRAQLSSSGTERPSLGIWDPADERRSVTMFGGTVNLLDVSTTATRFLVADSRTSRVQDADGRTVAQFATAERGALSPDGNAAFFMTADGVVTHWESGVLKSSVVGWTSTPIWWSYTTDGSHFLVLDDTGALYIFDHSGRAIDQQQLTSDGPQVDGRLRATTDGTETIVRTAGGKEYRLARNRIVFAGLPTILRNDKSAGSLGWYDWDRARTVIDEPVSMALFVKQSNVGLTRWQHELPITVSLDGTVSSIGCDAVRPRDGVVAVCDGTVVRLWPTHSDWPRFGTDAVAMSHTGARIAIAPKTMPLCWGCASSPSHPLLVDLSGARVATLEGGLPGGWNRLDFSPSGEAVYANSTVSGPARGSSTTFVRVWSAVSGVSQHYREGGDAFRQRSALLRADGRSLLASTSRYVEVQDLDSGNITKTALATEHSCGEFSQNGKRCFGITRGTLTRQIHVTDVETGNMLRTIDLGFATPRVGFTDDGEMMFAVRDDSTVFFWNTTSGDSLGSPLVPEYRVRDAAFSPDGTRFLTVGDDESHGAITVWDFATRASTLSFATGQRLATSSISFDGSTLLLVLRGKYDDSFYLNRWKPSEAVLFPIDTGMHIGRLCELLAFRTDYGKASGTCGGTARVLVDTVRDASPDRHDVSVRAHVEPPRVLSRLEVRVNNKVVRTCFNATSCSADVSRSSIVVAVAYDFSGNRLASSYEVDVSHDR